MSNPDDIVIITSLTHQRMILGRAWHGAGGQVRIEIELPVADAPGLLDTIKAFAAPLPEDVVEPAPVQRPALRRAPSPR